ncbi:MAG: chemotaxis protein CheD [Firmicutes bacterium]|jgi:chemotaxis protein CheD|nr:chemotaxis protein CheD [Bacillota bacterium]
MEIIVGIGECAVTNRSEAKLKTFALASCVAVTAYSKIRRAAGMVHIALPFPPHTEAARQRPAYYATTGIPLLLEKMHREFGCLRTELQIGVFGGADSARDKDYFSIGKKNIAAVMRLLSAMHLAASSIGVGGDVSRTVEMDVATGKVTITTQPIII